MVNVSLHVLKNWHWCIPSSFASTLQVKVKYILNLLFFSFAIVPKYSVSRGNKMVFCIKVIAKTQMFAHKSYFLTKLPKRDILKHTSFLEQNNNKAGEDLQHLSHDHGGCCEEVISRQRPYIANAENEWGILDHQNCQTDVLQSFVSCEWTKTHNDGNENRNVHSNGEFLSH